MKNNPSSPFRLVWGIAMVVIFLGMGYLLAFSPLFVESGLPEWARYCMAILFGLYGISRGYRIWRNR